jgi:transposase
VLHESRDQFSTVEVQPFVIERFEHACVLWCCVTISTRSKELLSNFVSNWVKVLPKHNELLQKVYGSDSLSHSTAFEWFKQFREGWELLEDDELSGRPTTSRNEQTIEKVCQLVMQDRHITLRMLSVELNVSKDTIRAIMHDDLGMKKCVLNLCLIS